MRESIKVTITNIHRRRVKAKVDEHRKEEQYITFDKSCVYKPSQHQQVFTTFSLK